MSAARGTLDVVAAVLMLVGAASCLLGAVGLARLPDTAARLQAATKPQTLGMALVLLGTALRVELIDAVTLVLVVLFQVITAPVVSQLVGRAAYRSGAVDRSRLVVDELAEHLPAVPDDTADTDTADTATADTGAERDRATS